MSQNHVELCGKSRISVNILGSSRITQNLQVTNQEEQEPQYAVENRALKKRGYLHCLRNVTLLPFSKYTKKRVSDYILCIA